MKKNTVGKSPNTTSAPPPPKLMPKPPKPLRVSKEVAKVIEEYKKELENLMYYKKYFLKEESVVMKPITQTTSPKKVSISIYSEPNDNDMALKKSIITEITQEILDMNYTQFDKGIEFYCFGVKNFSIYRDLDSTRNARIVPKIVLGDLALPPIFIPSMVSHNHSMSRLNFTTPQEYFRYIVVHEFGHILHDLVLDDSAVYHGYDDINPSTESTIASQVSEYAKTNKAEFVAEVFAGRMHGIVYNQEVLRLYNNLGGPPLEFSTPPLRKKFMLAPLQKGQYQQRVLDNETYLPFLDNLNEITDANVNFRPRRGSFPFRDADALPFPNFEPHLDFQKAAEHDWDAFYYHKQPKKNKTIQQKTLQDSIQRNLLKEDFPLAGPPKLARAVSVPDIVSNRSPSPTPPKNKLKF